MKKIETEMGTEELSKRTTINIQEKANLIWAIADKLVGTYKPHEYGNVILPMCVIKRFSDTLADTKESVLMMDKNLDERGLMVKDGFLRTASGYDFYNTSAFTFEGLLSDAENIAENFRSYLNHFSNNVIDIIEKFDFDKEITKLEHNGILYNVIAEFCTKKAYMGANEISAVDMGYIFEELVRKFSESYDEQAGAHFTARDIIYLMAEILVPHQNSTEGITASIYDMAMGTSQMLDCLSERLHQIDADAELSEFGQELNEQTFAIAKANMLIKGGNAENMRHGNTLSDDKFDGYRFDYIISNPPFGIEWKNEKNAVEAEHKKGDAGRFAAGLPAIGDSQQLFVLNGVAKLKDTGRMAIIQNGSPLFKGDAGSGESEIRGYLLEHDWLEAIIQIPNDMFYNTGIATYIWIITKDKSVERTGKVQLIDASKCCVKRRKPIGNKRNEFNDDCISLVKQAYLEFRDGCYSNDSIGISVESKIKDNENFKYRKVSVERPLRQIVDISEETLGELHKYMAHHHVFDEEDGIPERDVLRYAMRHPDVRAVKVAKTVPQIMASESLKVFYNTMKALKSDSPYTDVAEFEKLFNKHPENNLGIMSKFSNFSLIHYMFLKTDSSGNVVRDKKGNPVSDTSLRDTETIPWKQDIEEYMQKNVYPYAPDAWIDSKKTKIGYEIPFTREFYKYVPPRKSEDIFASLLELDRQEQKLMAKIIGR